MSQDEKSKYRSPLSEQQRALLEQRLRAINNAARPGAAVETQTTSAAHSTPRHIITRRPLPDAPAALSFAQQRLWFVDQLAPGSPFYNIAAAARLSGQLDLPKLRGAFDEIVRRHEILRTYFAMQAGQPVQIIEKSGRCSWSVRDLKDVDEKEGVAALEELKQVVAQHTFDLAKGPLLDVHVVKVLEREHVLLLTMHHIISDGWSIGVFFAELAALYTASVNGRPSPLAELPIQYADFARWQREWLSGEVLENQLAYWREQLAVAPPMLRLPTDRPRPLVQTFRGSFKKFTLSASLTESLDQFRRDEGVTLFMLLLAAFQTLLYRYTGQEQILVGTAIANRNQTQVENLIGFFVNTLVMSTKLSGEISFRQLLQRVREMAMGAYAHQDVPFEKLVEELQPERNLSYTPLFQVSMVLQNTPMSELELPSVKLAPLEIESETAKFDLTLLMKAEGGLIEGHVEYNTDLFDGTTIERMIGHFGNLLTSMLESPTRPISELNLLTEAERRQQLFAWNETTTDYRARPRLHELFEAQAARTPEAIAITFEEESLSYGELNARANQVAHMLKKLEARPETPVAVLMERSIEMVLALLGILKAGGAYVLINPTSTQEDQLAFILEDCRAPVILVQEKFRERLPAHKARAICLDADRELFCAESRSPASNDVRAENLACVLYATSANAAPKGVMITHRAISNQVSWLMERHPLTETDRVLQTTDLSQSMFAGEIFWPLSAGARLVLAHPEHEHESASLLKLISEQRITTLHLIPHLLRSLLNEQKTEDCRSLKRVMCSGEKLTPELQQTFFSKLEAELHNLYEMRETSGAAASRRCERTDERHAVPVGRPVANTRVYILDQNLQPVPVGVPGELYVGGAGVMRGYLNRPELTAERLIPDPHGKEPGARLYRTGDVARYLPDGNLQLLGKAERVLKMRGVNVELDEVEEVLGRHPAVSRVAVVAGDETQEDTRSLAYLSANAGQTFALSEVQDYLKSRLPEYMLPAELLLLDALPVKPGGKVDYLSLPAPDRARSEAHDIYVAPRDVLEWQLAQIWEEILEVRPVSVKSNFFALGGHSLSAINLIIEIQEKFGQELPVTTLFQGATIEFIAGVLREENQAQSQSPLVAIQPDGPRRPFFCVHAVGGNALAYIELARTLGTEQPFYGLQAPGLNGEQEPYQTIEEMARCYVEALRGLQPVGPYMLGGWSFGGVVAFEMARQLRLQNQEVALLALLDSQTPATFKGLLNQETSAIKLLANFLLDMEHTIGSELSASQAEKQFADLCEELETLGPEEQLDFVWERAKTAHVVPPNIGRQQMGHLWRVFRSNFDALINYAPESFDGQIVLLRARETHDENATDPTLGWAELSPNAVEVHYLPGNHYTMFTSPHVQALAERLRACFERASVA